MPAFTTADASERLAKRQTAKQLGVSAGIGSGVKVKIEKPNLVQSAVKALGSVYDAAKNQPGAQLSSPVNTGAGVSMGGQQNAVQNVVEPVRAAGRRAVGDLTAIPGVGKPSASPTATDFRAGNYVGPIVDYATLATTVAPGVAKGVGAVRNRPVYGIHSSPVADLDVIKPRVAGQSFGVAMDAIDDSSYMWDARSPYVGSGDVLKNPQMELLESMFMGENPNNLYLTRAPRRTIIQDANVPVSPSLRVRGPQEVVQQIPLSQEGLQQVLSQYGISTRSQLADKMANTWRRANPAYRQSVRDRPAQLEASRAAYLSQRATPEPGPVQQMAPGRRPAAELAREAQINRRADEIYKEYDFLDDVQARAMATVEMDFRDAALRMGTNEFGLAGDNLRNYQNLIRNGNIEEILQSNKDLDRLFTIMSDAAGYGADDLDRMISSMSGFGE